MIQRGVNEANVKTNTLYKTFTASIALCASILMLTGCSISPKSANNHSPVKIEWEERKNTLSKLHHWKLSGRFSAKSHNDSWSGSINWQQEQENYQITISGPLGTGSVKISGDDEFSELLISDEASYGATDAEALLESHTGLRLPMNNLRYWLIGLPSPTVEQETIDFDAFGRLKKITQQGWVVMFKRYGVTNNIELPNKIFLTNHEFDVRLVIQRWQLPS